MEKNKILGVLGTIITSAIGVVITEMMTEREIEKRVKDALAAERKNNEKN